MIEYQILEAASLINEHQLNELSKEGWELVTIVPQISLIYFYFKRDLMKVDELRRELQEVKESNRFLSEAIDAAVKDRDYFEEKSNAAFGTHLRETAVAIKHLFKRTRKEEGEG